MYRLMERRRGLSMWTLAMLVACLTLVGWRAPAPVVAQEPQEPGSMVEQAAPGAPVGLADSDTSVTMFVRNSDGWLWRHTRLPGTSGQWGSWRKTSHQIRANPAVARMLNNDPVLFAVSRDGKQLLYQTKTEGTWSTEGTIQRPSTVPDTVEFDGAPAVVANNDIATDTADLTPVRRDGKLQIFVRDTSNQLWWVSQTADNQIEPNKVNQTPWTWTNLGGGDLSGNPTAVVSGDGSIAVFARSTSDTVKYLMRIRDGSGFRAWEQWATLDALGTGSQSVAAAVVPHSSGSLLQVFANDSSGKLMTVTQTVPRSSTWTQATSVMDGPLQSAPIVVAGGEGRLVVFGLAGKGRKLVIRGQTAMANPASENASLHNGTWAGLVNKPRGGNPSLRSATVLSGEDGRLEVFAMDTNKHMRHVSQLVAGTVEQPEGWWLRWADLNPINAPCAGAGTVDCFTIAPADQPDHLLDVTSDLNRLVNSQPASGANTQRWRIEVDSIQEGTFRIRNEGVGQCLARLEKRLTDQELVIAPALEECAEVARQRWYLLPYTAPVAAGEDEAERKKTYIPTQFRIASYENNNDCVVRSGKFWWCTNHNDQCCMDTVFTLGMRGRTAPGMLDLAMGRTVQGCQGDKNLHQCEFMSSETATIDRAAAGCVASAVVYNPDPQNVLPYTVKWAETTGTHFAISGGLKLGLPGKILGLDANFTATHTWLKLRTEEGSMTIQVPAGNFGWLETRPLMRRTTGYWNLQTSLGAWTVPGENISVSGVGTYNAPMYSKHPPTQDRCPQGAGQPQ
jgi:hypothetical protein